MRETGDYAKIVELTHSAVKSFTTDWERSPTHWVTEADIQAELYGRIRARLEGAGLGYVEGNYPGYVKIGLPKPQLWSRVSCGSSLGRIGSETPSKYSIPDLTVYKDLEDPDRPPDNVHAGTWPALWICEIKAESATGITDDRSKVQSLIASGEVEAGTCLEFKLARPRFDTEPGWQHSSLLGYFEYRGRLG